MDTVADFSSAITGLPTAEVLTGGVEVIDQLASEWQALCDQGRYNEPFYRPEWIAAYVRAFAQDKTVAVATARCGGQLIAVLPLIRETSFSWGLPVRKLRGAANVHTCRYDLVHHPGAAGIAISAIWEALRSTRGWDVLELPNVPLRGAVGQLVRHARAHGYAAHVIRSASRCPYIGLPEAEQAFDMRLPHLDAKFRSNLRRRLRKLEMYGAVRLVSTHKVDERLAHFYALEHGGWKGAERSAIVCNAPMRQFYDEIAREGERYGYLSLYALECGGRPVAMHYGLRRAARYYLLKTAYDESLKDCSPGQLITQEVLRALAAERCVEFNFLGTLADWKKDWRPRLLPHANWYVLRGPMGHLLQHLRFCVRPAIGRALRVWKEAPRVYIVSRT